MPQGWRGAKDAYKRKNASKAGGSSGANVGAAAPHGTTQNRQREFSNKGKAQKHSGPQATSNQTGTGGAQQNNWVSRRQESTLWLLLVNRLQKKSLLPVRKIITSEELRCYLLSACGFRFLTLAHAIFVLNA